MKYLALAVVLCACGVSTGEAQQEIHSWSYFHWGDGAFPLEYDNNTKNSSWDDTIMGGICDWNHLNTPVQIEEVPVENARISVEQRRSQQWLGLAQVYLDSSGHITKGKVTLNPTLLENPDFTPVAAQHVFCQELGHVYGLTHIPGDTCMDDCSWASNREEWLTCLNDPASVGPNLHDQEQLNVIYSHDHSSPDAGSVDASVADAGSEIDAGSEPAIPGCGKGKNPKCGQGWLTVHELELM